MEFRGMPCVKTVQKTSGPQGEKCKKCCAVVLKPSLKMTILYLEGKTPKNIKQYLKKWTMKNPDVEDSPLFVRSAEHFPELSALELIFLSIAIRQNCILSIMIIRRRRLLTAKI